MEFNKKEDDLFAEAPLLQDSHKRIQLESKEVSTKRKYFFDYYQSLFSIENSLDLPV
jgi:hypothetical protein